MNCETARKCLPLYAGGDVSDEVAKGVAMHLLECEPCQAELEVYRSSLGALSGLGKQTLSRDAIDALQRNVKAMTRSPVKATLPREVRIFGFRVERWRAWTAAAMAAGVLLAAGLWTFRPSGAARSGGTPPMESREEPDAGVTVGQMAGPPAAEPRLPGPTDDVAAAGDVPRPSPVAVASDEGPVETIYSMERVRTPFILHTQVDFPEGDGVTLTPGRPGTGTPSPSGPVRALLVKF